MLDKFVDNSRNDIVQKVQELIRIPSVYADSSDSSKPFGENIDRALEYMLDLGKSLGFRVKNVDGYCGYIEFGEGDDIVGIIGHLDVVPEGDGWTYPPFHATISNNRIYGRGAIDDKGPVISSLYAMKAVMDNCNVNKRVRLILGLNEEKDWNCINYYKEHEELPTISFSPDADFPCIYAEKSIMSSYLKMNYSNYLDKDIVIKKIDCNNNALNVVPKVCHVVLEINTENILLNEFINLMNILINHYEFNISIDSIDSRHVQITSYGVQAHAAHPDLGINAISQLIVILNDAFRHYNINLNLIEFFSKFIGIQFYGENLGINCEDESGCLTLNVGAFNLIDNVLMIGMNIRIPIHTPIENVENKFLNSISSYANISFIAERYQPALFIDKDNYLVKTLCGIFNEITDSNFEPIAIGGATYARAFKNCVSFGANFPGDKDMCHQTDEFIDIDKLILSTKIYAKAIYELAND